VALKENKRLLLYSGFERFWHWAQATLMIFLLVTGFEVHGSFVLFGFDAAVQYHRIAGALLILLIAFTIFWHVTTGEWRQYIPTTRNINKYFLFYTKGIFKGEAHPSERTRSKKLNPLQIITYLIFKVIVVPSFFITGLLYWRHKSMVGVESVSILPVKLEVIAAIHTATAYMLLSFFLMHLYMITTPHSPVAAIRSMVTGFDHEAEVQNQAVTNTTTEVKQ